MTAATPLPRLLPERVSELALTTRRIGQPALWYDRVASTMPLAHALAAHGARDGTAVLAEEQLAGQGRRGRHWSAPHGTALLCSLILRPLLPADQLFLLTALTSLGLCLGIEQVTGLCPAVKWPNDLLLDGRKLAGVLCATEFLGAALDHAVVGFGLNVNVEEGRLPATTSPALPATSLAFALGRAVDRMALTRAVLSAIDALYAQLWEGETEAIFVAWRARLSGLGEVACVVTAGGIVEGRCAGVDRDGALVLATAHGSQRVLAGDVVLGPRTTSE